MQVILDKFSYFINLEDTKNFLKNWFDFIKNIFLKSPFFVLIYLVLIIILIVFSNLLYSNYKKSQKKLLLEIDKILYKLNMLIYKHKSEIHNFEESIKLLFSNQNKILTENNLNFVDNFDLLLEDVKYIEQALQINILRQENLENLNLIFDIYKKNKLLYQTLSNIIVILTLWIYWFFKKK